MIKVYINPDYLDLLSFGKSVIVHSRPNGGRFELSLAVGSFKISGWNSTDTESQMTIQLTTKKGMFSP